MRKRINALLAVFAVVLLLVGCTQKDERYDQIEKVVYKTNASWGIAEELPYYTLTFDFETKTATFESGLLDGETIIKTWEQPMTDEQIEHLRNVLIKYDFFNLPAYYEFEAEDGDYQGITVVVGGEEYTTGGFMPDDKRFNAIQEEIFQVISAIEP